MVATRPQLQKNSLEDKLATFVVGVDTLLGGDGFSPSGLDRFILDSWTSDFDAPEIFFGKMEYFGLNDQIALRDSSARTIRKYRGVEGINSETSRYPPWNRHGIIVDFVKKYRLSELADEIKQIVDKDTLMDPIRKQYISNMVQAVDIARRAILAESHRIHGLPYDDEPTFDEKYLGLFGGAIKTVELADPTETRNKMGDALVALGYAIEKSNTGYELNSLKLAATEWFDSLESVEPNEIGNLADQYARTFVDLTREHLLRHLVFFGDDLHFDQTAFNGYKISIVSGTYFSGFSAYVGGTDESGKPKLVQVCELDSDKPANRKKISLFSIVAHEQGGHYMQSAVEDLAVRAGRLGFESTMSLMCAPQTVFHEAWAQEYGKLLFGSHEAAFLAYSQITGVDAKHFEVLHHLDRLKDIAKHNVSMLFQKYGKSEEQIRDHLERECVLDSKYANSMLGRWTKDRIFGPMYGPSYLRGRDMVSQAIDSIGRLNVAKIGFSLNGVVDSATFLRLVEKYQSNTY